MPFENSRKSTVSLKTRALRFLARRDYGEVELARKLKPYAENPEEIAPLLNWLKTQGFLNEARFVDAAARARAPRMGARRIGSFLRAQGVASEHIATTVADLRETEGQRAHALWARKFGQLPQNIQERARQTRFLISRGFESDIVRKVLSGRFVDEFSE